MAIHQWPIGERPREKLQERGAGALTRTGDREEPGGGARREGVGAE